MLRTLIRFDDYSAISNTDLERQILQRAAEVGAKVTVGVVPFVAELEWDVRGPIRLLKLPPEKVRLLKEFLPETAEVALHGYCHQAISRTSGMMEFGDRISRETQLARLRDVKAYLEDSFGVPVTTFVPPWNEYGTSTLWALKEAAFTNMSADAAFGPLDAGLSYLPASCGPSQFLEALNVGRCDPEAVVCMMLHEYDFKESGCQKGKMTLTEFREMLVAARGQGRWMHCSGCVSEQAGPPEQARLNQELRRALSSPLRHFMLRNAKLVYWGCRAAQEKLRRLKRASRLLRAMFIKTACL